MKRVTKSVGRHAAVSARPGSHAQSRPLAAPSEATRRQFLAQAALAAGAWPVLGCAHSAAAGERGPFASAGPGLHYGPERAFDFDGLVERARHRAARTYQPPPQPAPHLVQQIDYDAHGKLHFRRERALFADQGPYPATLFPLGEYFPYTTRIFALAGGQAREIRYSPEYFDMPADSVARKLPADAGFAGFRLHESVERSDWKTQDWLAFLGASYFRAIGALGQYGLSARGIAVNTAAGVPEEFPLFTELYLEAPETAEQPVRVCALLDGPSIAGAFTFLCYREQGVRMRVDARLFARADIPQLGVAPLTSMYWYAEKDRPRGVDWRPEVHDSDGLVISTGKGERLFRPLNNPGRVVTSSFSDRDPKGFGLVQRDRDVENYLDGVSYQRRPSLWVEPIGRWGEGQVQLVEIPTDDETHDNVVAFWHPEGPVRAGAELRFEYGLHWEADDPHQRASLATVSATRLGAGGEPGQERLKDATRLVVEFEGEPMERDFDSLPEAQIEASRGEVFHVKVEHVPYTSRLRVVFDLRAEGSDPVELRLALQRAGRALGETWLYQHWPESEG